MSSCVVLMFLSNGSTLPVLGVMNVSTFTGFLLFLYQHCLPIKGIFWVLTLVSYICSCVHAVIHYYNGSTAGCGNCYRMCKPCNSRCKCKGNCRNPHNDGGTCARCEPQDETDDSVSDDEERLPLVTQSADTFDSESDDSDQEADQS